METTRKIRMLLVRRGISQASLARKLSPNGTPQNLNNKMKRGDFRESELRAIANELECDVEINFVMHDTGEKL